MTSMNGRRGSRADELLADWDGVVGRARRPAEAPTGPAVSGLGALARFAAPAVFAGMVVLAVGVLVPRGPEEGRMGVGASPVASADLLDACPVTVPNGAHGGAWPETPLDHGADGIFTALAPDGTIEVGPDGNGTLWRAMLFSLAGPAHGPLGVTGHRWAHDDAEIKASPGILSETVQAEYPDGDDGAGVMRVDLGFPGEGCWEIVATAGPSQLRFVTRVVSGERTVAELVGSPAPSTWLDRMDGGQSGLPILAGRPSVVTFVSSWCPPCAGEAAVLAVEADDGIDRVLVAVKDDRAAVANAYDDAMLPVLLDPDGSAFAAYGGFGLPLTVFIDAEGTIRSYVAGPLDKATLASGIAAIGVARFVPEPSGSPIVVPPEPAASPAG